MLVLLGLRLDRRRRDEQPGTQFGEPEPVRRGLEAIYDRSHVALLIDNAMAWKERTMKTGWKWRFVAHVGLALLLTLQVLFVIATLIWIFPKVEYGQAMFEEQFPDYFRFRSTWGYLWGA